MNSIYQEAKATHGIITSLPFSPGATEQSDADRLKFYLKSQGNRDRYWDEIADLLREDPSLLPVYHQEMGKSHARSLGKRLREIGIADAWFAVLEGVIIAGARSKDDLDRVIEDLVPHGKESHVYAFRVK